MTVKVQAETLPNAFIGRADIPAEVDLSAELGRAAKARWDKLLSKLAEEHRLVTREWHSYSRKAGWALRLKMGERNILYLGPCHGCFRASFVLGDKAVAAARASGLPDDVIENINGSRRYAEGTAVRIMVDAMKDVAAVVRLAGIKLAN